MTSFHLAKIEVPYQTVEDTLVNAIDSAYGGSNYWMRIGKRVNSKPDREGKDRMPSYIVTPLSDDGALEIIDFEEDGIYTLNRQALSYGLQVMAEKYPRHFADMLTGNGDAETGDVLLQCALFGEVRYG